jgi:hypothetical protein
MNLRYKARALRHIEAIHDYIAQDDMLYECCDGSNIPSLGLPFFRSQVVQASLRELESSSFPVCPMS